MYKRGQSGDTLPQQKRVQQFRFLPEVRLRYHLSALQRFADPPRQQPVQRSALPLLRLRDAGPVKMPGMRFGASAWQGVRNTDGGGGAEVAFR